MKKTYIIGVLLAWTIPAVAQEDFSKNLADARSAYASGNLSDARFAMEQMMREVDMAIGKEILKMLPTTLGDRVANEEDNGVNGSATGFTTGLYVHRSYGTAPKLATVDIINNSPLINSISALLAIPFLGNAGDSNQKVIKVQGYKSLLTKSEDSTGGQVDYELQIPFNNTLFTFRMDDTSEADIVRLADTLPLGKIAQIAQ